MKNKPFVLYAACIGLVFVCGCSKEYKGTREKAQQKELSAEEIKIRDFYEGEAIKNEGGKNYDKAIECWKELIKQIPSIIDRSNSRVRICLSDTYLARGTEFNNKGDYKNAIEDYTEGVKLQPPNIGRLSLLYLSRGIAFTKATEYNRAINDFNKVIEMRPSGGWAYLIGDAYLNRGDAYCYKRDIDTAYSDYSKAIELISSQLSSNEVPELLKEGLKPVLATAYLELGSILYSKNRYEEAITNLEKAVELNPSLKSLAEPSIKKAKLELKK